MTTLLTSSHSLITFISVIILASLQPSLPAPEPAVDGIYGGCSMRKFSPGSPFESNLNSLLASLVNSATKSSYNNFTAAGPTGQAADVVRGLYQCRGDLSASDCAACVSGTVSQFARYCPSATGGVLQMDGCMVRYDSADFIGVEDKTVEYKSCGSSDATAADSVNAVLASLRGPSGVHGGGDQALGVSQCVGDLSFDQCQDCLWEAIGRLRSECNGTAVSGDMFLGKCYARYMLGQSQQQSNGLIEKGKALAKNHMIIVGIIAAIIVLALVLICCCILQRKCKKRKDPPSGPSPPPSIPPATGRSPPRRGY